MVETGVASLIAMLNGPLGFVLGTYLILAGALSIIRTNVVAGIFCTLSGAILINGGKILTTIFPDLQKTVESGGVASANVATKVWIIFGVGLAVGSLLTWYERKKRRQALMALLENGDNLAQPRLDTLVIPPAEPVEIERLAKAGGERPEKIRATEPGKIHPKGYRKIALD